MEKTFTCPRGHRWQACGANGAENRLAAIACPECGGTAVTLPPPESHPAPAGALKEDDSSPGAEAETGHPSPVLQAPPSPRHRGAAPAGG
jgi:hypothetical protein